LSPPKERTSLLLALCRRWVFHAEHRPEHAKGPASCLSERSGELEFGVWGERFAWRCVKNPHHRLAIHRNHLRLPKMVALVPKRERRKLDKQLGLKENSGQQQSPSGGATLAIRWDSLSPAPQFEKARLMTGICIELGGPNHRRISAHQPSAPSITFQRRSLDRSGLVQSQEVAF